MVFKSPQDLRAWPERGRENPPTRFAAAPTAGGADSGETNAPRSRHRCIGSKRRHSCQPPLFLALSRQAEEDSDGHELPFGVAGAHRGVAGDIRHSEPPAEASSPAPSTRACYQVTLQLRLQSEGILSWRIVSKAGARASISQTGRSLSSGTRPPSTVFRYERTMPTARCVDSGRRTAPLHEGRTLAILRVRASQPPHTGRMRSGTSRSSRSSPSASSALRIEVRRAGPGEELVVLVVLRRQGGQERSGSSAAEADPTSQPAVLRQNSPIARPNRK